MRRKVGPVVREDRQLCCERGYRPLISTLTGFDGEFSRVLCNCPANSRLASSGRLRVLLGAENSDMRQRHPERVRVWRDLIATWKQSGLTINAFCRERKLTRSNFDRARGWPQGDRLARRSHPCRSARRPHVGRPVRLQESARRQAEDPSQLVAHCRRRPACSYDYADGAGRTHCSPLAGGSLLLITCRRHSIAMKGTRTERVDGTCNR